MSNTKYDDIIGLPHYEPKYHTRMPMENRAAQFAPFAALTGHSAAISETARLTEEMLELSAEQQLEIPRRLALALERHARITITFFRHDARKSGGRYIDIAGEIKKIDDIERSVLLTDGRTLPLDMIADLRGEIFD